MYLVLQVKLLPAPEQAAALEKTVRRCNDVASSISRRAFESRTFARIPLQRAVYLDVKAAGLSAQPAIHVIRKVADGYKTLHANIKAGSYGPAGDKRRVAAESKPITFRPLAAQPYDDRCLSWQHDASTVSIWTVDGRVAGVRYVVSKEQREMLVRYRKGESDLLFRDGHWYLNATCDVPEAVSNDALAGWIGVDMGIVNIATTSEGKRYAGQEINGYRRRQLRIRKRLQAKGTKSAKRLLKKRRRKESRTACHINHQISKSIVTEAQRTGCGVVIEDLDGIRDRVRLKKPQRVAMHHQWAFRELALFIEYKARLAGVSFLKVDPRYSSQQCSCCGVIDKANRRSQSEFECVICGFVEHADHNAAANLRVRGAACWAEVNLPYAA